MKEKKKYTIIYSESKLLGSHWNSITKIKYATTDNIKKYLSLNGFDTNHWFIFDGHCKESKI